MNRNLIKIIVLFSLILLTSAIEKNADAFSAVRRPNRIITDLNNDNVPDTISLHTSANDSTSFDRITISITGFGKHTYIAKNGWYTVDSEFVSNNKNAVETDKLFLLKAKDHAIILLFGQLDGAGYREDFSIIIIKNNTAKLVFDKGDTDVDVECPIALKDIDNDGRTDFIFRNIFEFDGGIDSLNVDIGTYSPYLVYTIDEGYQMNKELTKIY